MKIIHVDDHRYAREEIQEQIPQIVPEAELHCFDDPDSALAFAEANGCDVLLTEIELWSKPLGGIRLAERIREINPRVHIIFVTVCSKHEVARELAGLPVSGFLPKPWKPEELAAAFQNLSNPVADTLPCEPCHRGSKLERIYKALQNRIQRRGTRRDGGNR